MSNIDQAFINAYMDQPTVVQPPLPRQSAGPRAAAPGPQLRVFAQSAESPPRTLRYEDAEPTVVMRPQSFARPAEDSYAVIAPEQQNHFSSQGVEESEMLNLPSRVSERRPLSSFAPPKPAPTAAFKPLFEVDEFRWPAITDDLLRSSKNLLLPIVENLLAGSQDGKSLVGLAGTATGVGVSTVTMCLARIAAQSGQNVALVDANFVRGNLAASLGLEFDAGWEDVLTGQIPLAECAVLSLADKLTLIPLGGPALAESDRVANIQSSVIAGMLRYHYDLVLFDLGAPQDNTQLSVTHNIVEHCRLDGAIVVAPSNSKDAATVHAVEQLNKVLGTLCLGIIGNRAN